MIRTQIGVRSLTDSSSHKEHHPFAVEAAFSGFEIKRLTEVLKLSNIKEEPALTMGDSKFGSPSEDSERKAYSTNIPIIEEFAWFYEKLEELVFNVNQSVYEYNLSGMFEESIYLRYDGEEGGKYDPHMDMGGTFPTGLRKISSTIILNDDYEGGDLIFEGLGEMPNGDPVIYYPKTPGTIVFFPSFLLHGVTPVTKGTRYSIVTWFHGPGFV